jgi:hypothetical protein
MEWDCLGAGVPAPIMFLFPDRHPEDWYLAAPRDRDDMAWSAE